MYLRPEVVASMIQSAVQYGVIEGLERSVEVARQPENANNPNTIADVVIWTVLQHLNQVIDLKLERFTNEQSESEVPEETRSADQVG